MKSLFCRQHTGSSIVERCQFQGVLVCLGTRVDEEQLIVVIPRSLAQSCGKFLLKWVLHGVTVKAQLVQLLGHCLDIVRVAVSDTDDSMTAIQVKVFLPLLIPHMAALAVVDGYVKKWINVE